MILQERNQGHDRLAVLLSTRVQQAPDILQGLILAPEKQSRTTTRPDYVHKKQKLHYAVREVLALSLSPSMVTLCVERASKHKCSQGLPSRRSIPWMRLHNLQTLA